MAEKISFEKSVEQLGDIVKALESGQTPLDEAMKLFEKGIKLTKQCNDMLDAAEKKVNLIIKETGEVTEFDAVEE